jgi:hypothetical protein
MDITVDITATPGRLHWFPSSVSVITAGGLHTLNEISKLLTESDLAYGASQSAPLNILYRYFELLVFINYLDTKRIIQALLVSGLAIYEYEAHPDVT